MWAWFLLGLDPEPSSDPHRLSPPRGNFPCSGLVVNQRGGAENAGLVYDCCLELSASWSHDLRGERNLRDGTVPTSTHCVSIDNAPRCSLGEPTIREAPGMREGFSNTKVLFQISHVVGTWGEQIAHANGLTGPVFAQNKRAHVTVSLLCTAEEESNVTSNHPAASCLFRTEASPTPSLTPHGRRLALLYAHLTSLERGGGCLVLGCCQATPENRPECEKKQFDVTGPSNNATATAGGGWRGFQKIEFEIAVEVQADEVACAEPQ